MRLPIVAVAAAALCVSSLTARADTVYTYTGHDYTNSVQGNYTTTESVTGSFTLADPLAPNDLNVLVTPLAFSFYDGINTYTPSNVPDYRFAFTTGGSGNIVFYTIELFRDSSALDELIVTPTQDIAADTNNGVAIAPGPGSFSSYTPSIPTSVTPEPSSIALLGTGLLGVAGVVRKRFA